MLGIFFRGERGLKRSTAVLVEFTEKFYVLQSRGMHEGSEHIDREIEHVSDDENERHHYKSAYRRSSHRAQKIYHLRDNSCREAERKYSRVLEKVGAVIYQIVKSK